MLTNAACLYFAVGCLTYLLSALTDRRGRALGAALAILLASFLINFLAELWAPAHPFGFLSFLDYYRPLDVLRADEWPLGNMAVLVGAGIVFWCVGGAAFSRRDIHVT